MLKGTSACCRKGDHNTTRKRIGFEANPRKAQMKKLLLILLVVGIAVFAAKPIPASPWPGVDPISGPRQASQA